MTETNQLALNLSGYAQAALPLITEEAARDEFRRPGRDLNAVPPPRTAPVRDVVRRVAVAQETAPFVAQSDTSKAAAAALTPEKLSQQGRLVLDYLREQGAEGATDMEILAAVPLREASARRARVVLMDRGYVVDSGQRRVNPGSGKYVAVWVAADRQKEQDAA